jgi:hypothetical protein
VFKLPLVEQRKIINAPFLEHCFFGRGSLRKEVDGLYIYYLAFKWSLIVNGVIALLFILSHFLNVPIAFWFLRVNLTGSDFIENFFINYVQQISNILLFGVLPFYLIMFRFHYNPRKYDIRAWNPNVATLNPPEPKKICLYTIIALSALCWIMYKSDEIFIYIMNAAHLNTSIIYLAISTFIIAFLYALFVRIQLELLVFLWRYSGHYE